MTISYEASGALQYGTTGATTTAYPTGLTAGDYLIMFMGIKSSTATTTTPSGWQKLGSFAGGGGTTGLDTGPTVIYAFGRVSNGAESGTVASTPTSADNWWAQIHRFATSTGASWLALASSGADATTGTAWSATVSANIGLTAGDMAVVGSCIPTDVSTPTQFSAEAVTATGVTMGTAVEISEPTSASGNDIGGFQFYQPVSSGTSTADPVVTATAGGTTTNVRGPSMLVRLREADSSWAPAIDVPWLTYSSLAAAAATTIAGSPGWLREKRTGVAENTPGGAQSSTAALDMTNSTRFRYISIPSAVGQTSNPGNYVETELKPGGAPQAAKWPFCFEFTTGSAQVQIRVNATVTNTRVGTIAVNGKRVQEQAHYAVSTAGSGLGILLTFPDARTRTISIYGLNNGDGRFGGLAVESGYTATKPTPTIARRVAVIGDSFANGAGTSPDGASNTETFPWLLSQLMGGDEVVFAGIGSTGWIAISPGEPTSNFAGRITPVMAFSPHVVIWAGGRNDSDTGLQAAIEADFDSVGSGVERYVLRTSTNGSTAVNAAIAAACASRGVPYLDVDIDAIEKIADGIHPSLPGHFALAEAAFALMPVELAPTAIASGEAFGTVVISTTSGATTLSPSAIASAEAFGTVVVSGVLAASPTGIATAEALGAPVATGVLTTSPTGVATSEAFGTVALTGALTLSPSSIATGEAVGTPGVTNVLTVTPSGVATAEALGAPTIALLTTMAPSGIVSTETFGATVVSGSLTATVTGIASTESFGTPSVANGLTVAPTGVASTEALGAPALTATLTVAPGAIASTEAFGPVVVVVTTPVSVAGIASAEQLGVPVITNGGVLVAPSGVATGETFGTPVATMDIPVAASGIASSEIFGTPTAIADGIAFPSSIATIETFGSPTLSTTLTASPSGIVTAEAFGTAAASGLLTVSPSGIASAQAFGTPALTGALTASPTGIASGETFGTPTYSGTTTAAPTGITSVAAVGTPTVSLSTTVSPTGIATVAAVGTVSITTSIPVSVGSIPSTETFGSAVVSTTLAVTAGTIGTAEAFGSPGVFAVMSVSPSGIASAEDHGAPGVTLTLVATVSGIATAEALGAPTATGAPHDVTVTAVLGEKRWRGASSGQTGSGTLGTDGASRRWKGLTP